MRISNPKLFNGQTLATKQQISGGLITIPSASISGLSALAAAVSANATDISTNATNISTISGALGTLNSASETTAFGKILALQSAIKDLTGQEGDGNVLSLKDINDRLTTEITERAAADEYISGIVDELSGWQDDFVDKTATVEGTGLAEVITGAVVNGVQTFTVNVPSAAAFASHTIELAKLEQAEDGYASSYQLMVDGAKQGDTINIPKDQFLKGAEIVEGNYVDSVFTASEGGNKYIHFTFEIKVKDAALAETTQEKHIYLDIQDLCDVYTGGKGITIDANNIIDLNVATSGEIGGVKSGGDIQVAADGTVSVLSARFADVAGKVENALTAFGKAYDGSEAVTVSGKTGTEKYITYSQDAGVFTVGAKGLDVANGNYVLSDNTVAANLTALDTQVKANADAIADNAAAIEANADAIADNADAIADNAAAIATNTADIAKHATAIATAVTFEEVSLAELSSKSSVTVEGRVMQVFDADGWVYPEVKFTTTTDGNVSSTVSIEEWPTSGVPGLSALVSKKVTIA